MNLRFRKNKVLCTFLFCLFAFIGGGINGFLGTGGGIIFVLLLSIFTKNNSKDNYATSLCATIVLSIIGIFSYIQNQNVDFDLTIKLSLFAISGGAVGALITDKINTRWLGILFSALIIYSGTCMIFK